ncbi:MAG: prenyltransferase [Caldimonas sp.]
MGLAGLVLVATYTPIVTRRPLLCLLAPGSGFAPVMVLGTSFALGGGYSWAALAASLPPLFLVSGLLLINQFPDIDADRRIGRRNLPIAMGRRRSAVAFDVLVFAAFLSMAAAAAIGLLSPWSLLGLTGLPVGAFLAQRVYLYADDLPRLVPSLGINVAMIHASLLLFGLGLLWR